ncbi:lytic polysaccharide monooxygenase auxiliary activity family 9 protein [Lentzea flaviverrucosa]|uniref:Chitin-binding protein n=1 Tax=Lentzea flaviverrucosa TaxID=200379 RepID=A0A1H9CUS2_9PSEU|nr:lytic polysaccharide monooxygenase [Lentzea flaviverrucosa]RDI24651.1 chitin-binding protein [Lentzea flaviverrucosa]SEQ04837.1 chitin-binding protein [Lentzea flaviverrucosa]
MKTRTRLALASLSATTAVVVAFIVPTTPAIAHGTMSDPASRVYTCKNEGPETPKSDACKAAVAAGGTQAYYDWNEVSLLEAGGRHRQLIPDGKLCSAGRDKYRGLDLQRADWPAKRVSPGPLTVTYHASAPHSNSNFEFYITRDGWNPTQPLRWSDLVHIQTFNGQNPSTFTNWTLNIPNRSGRHVLYSIWQRVVGSNEAFYTCSDVDFGGGTTNPPTTTTTTTQPPTTTTTTQPPAGGTWAAGTTYSVGNRVTYNGVNYECQLAHTAISGWEPPATPALWRRL